MRRAIEKWFAPAARRLGWRTEFAWARYAGWAEGADDMRLIERRAMPPLGHFSLIRFGKSAEGAAPSLAAGAARSTIAQDDRASQRAKPLSLRPSRAGAGGT